GARGALHGRGSGGEGRLIAWAAVDPVTGDVEHEDGSRVFTAASTIKLFVYSAYRRSALDPGEVVAVVRLGGSGVAEYLGTPLSPAAHASRMWAVSATGSPNALLERLGLEGAAGDLERLGLRDTRVRRPMMSSGPENETTPLDLAQGLARLLEEEFAGDLLEP